MLLLLQTRWQVTNEEKTGMWLRKTEHIFFPLININEQLLIKGTFSGSAIVWIWAYPMKVKPETRRAH